MKFHPFNIAYIEETEKMSIIRHDDITSDNFRNEMSYNQSIKNEIISLLYVTIKNKDIYHGDIYLDKLSKKIYIYTLNKLNSSSDIVNHGFFLLKEHKDSDKIELIFDKNEFIIGEEFITDDLVYIGNVFVHLNINKQLVGTLNKELNNDENYSLSNLENEYKECKGDFYFSTKFFIYFYNKMAVYKENISKWMYEPFQLTEKIVQINEEDNWEIGIEKQYEVFHWVHKNVFKNNFVIITGVHYKTIFNDEEYFTLFNMVEYYLQLKDKMPFFDYYKSFFAHYDGEKLIIKSSINNVDFNEFIFDEKPIPYNVSNLFRINSNKESDVYMNELLKII